MNPNPANRCCTPSWSRTFSIPYALLLSIMVALLDLIPVVGFMVAGAVVALVALTVSLPMFLAAIDYIVVYRLLEDYVLGVIGALVAIPAVSRRSTPRPGLSCHPRFRSARRIQGSVATAGAESFLPALLPPLLRGPFLLRRTASSIRLWQAR